MPGAPLSSYAGLLAPSRPEEWAMRPTYFFLAVLFLAAFFVPVLLLGPLLILLLRHRTSSKQHVRRCPCRKPGWDGGSADSPPEVGDIVAPSPPDERAMRPTYLLLGCRLLGSLLPSSWPPYVLQTAAEANLRKVRHHDDRSQLSGWDQHGPRRATQRLVRRQDAHARGIGLLTRCASETVRRA